MATIPDPTMHYRQSKHRKRIVGKVLIYALLLFWTFVSLFPIFWTVSTSFKVAVDVTQDHIVPWLQYQPDWKGWRSLGLSPDTIRTFSSTRAEFFKRFNNSAIISISFG